MMNGPVLRPINMINPMKHKPPKPEPADQDSGGHRSAFVGLVRKAAEVADGEEPAKNGIPR